jgi:hypothetical protein
MLVLATSNIHIHYYRKNPFALETELLFSFKIEYCEHEQCMQTNLLAQMIYQFQQTPHRREQQYLHIYFGTMGTKRQKNLFSPLRESLFALHGRSIVGTMLGSGAKQNFAC